MIMIKYAIQVSGTVYGKRVIGWYKRSDYVTTPDIINAMLYHRDIDAKARAHAIEMANEQYKHNLKTKVKRVKLTAEVLEDV